MSLSAASAVPVAAADGPVLRDIHLPPAPAWWPPAPGWWALGVLVLLLFGVGWWLGRRHRQRRRWQRQLMVELDQLAQLHVDDHAALANALHQLLRRVARRHDASAVQQSGAEWRQTLGRVAVDAATLNCLLALDDALYRPQPDFDVTATLKAVRLWLQRAARPRAWKRLKKDVRSG